jgi:PAS domain S-box-containing protein
MKAPAIPRSEPGRIEALRSYGVLDTPPEAAFDDLARLAAIVMGTPIGLVSLVDETRQWFKARHGIEVTESQRALSFCGHAVADGLTLIVPDAREDDRFADNPMVKGEPGIVFYAGAPLLTRHGHPLGTLCVMDRTPRSPTKDQREALELLARQVVDQLEARREQLCLETERTAALEVARQFRAVFESVTEGVVLQDTEGTILAANAAAEGILGLTTDQLAGRTSLDPRWRGVHEDGSDFPGSEHPAWVALQTGLPLVNVVMGVHKPDDSLSWIRINALPLRRPEDPSPYAVVTTFHDVTAAKHAQESAQRLALQERLVTTGTLAAGVGHEINNPLTFIVTNIDFLLEVAGPAGSQPTPAWDDVRQALRDAREGAERVRTIVRGLQALAREDSRPTPTSVVDAIDVSITIAAHEVRHKATLTTALGSTPPVLADRSRLSQVIVNLVVNAAQAFPTGDICKNRIWVTSGVEPDGRVFIAVRDNGPGVPADLRGRIFNPFFTTKPSGVGTGLGLSISHNIVLALGGVLTLESSEGGGATFRVVLPAASGTATGARPSLARPASRRGRILVVDDEATVVATVRRVLGKDHDVTTLTDPREAVARLAEGDPYDLVLCDVTMPYLSGRALYEQTLRERPANAARFVFMTGGATDDATQSFLQTASNPHVTKPFTLDALRQVASRFVSSIPPGRAA